MWNKPLAHTPVVLAFIVLLTACHSRRVAMEGRPVRNLSTSRIIDSIMKYRFAPDYFSTKMSVDAELPDDSKSFKVNLRMKRDSVVWGQVSLLVVAAQALITRDSVHILQFLGEGKGYYPRSIEAISDLLNTDLDLKMLQDILLANPLEFDPEEKYKSPADTGYYYLSSHRKRKIRRAIHRDRAPKKDPIIYQYWFYPGTFKTYRMTRTDMEDSTSLYITYPEFEMVDSVLVPASAEIEAVKGDKKLKLLLKYSRTKVNQKLDFPFTVPESYERK